MNATRHWSERNAATRWFAEVVWSIIGLLLAAVDVVGAVLIGWRPRNR